MADITVIGKLDDLPIRNANVLYEVGLAHAIRLPEEVALLRSDNEMLLFDVMNILILNYDPDKDPDTARKLVAYTIAQSLRELDLQKSLTPRRVAESLDGYSCGVVLQAATERAVKYPQCRTVGDVVGGTMRRNAIDHLLEAVVLRAELDGLMPEQMTKSPEEVIEYSITELGRAVAAYLVKST